MAANQFPVEPHPDAPDPTVDRVVPDTPEEDLRGRALRRLKKKADFRSHLMIYVLVNGMLVLIWAMTGSGFFWPAFVLGGWGIGLVANAVDAYVVDTPTEEQIESEMERLRRR
ncbi:2TM domain-containing protein [Terrabacter sp. C0L_2]|uniref:2TM domain-containing protein n=1 Tax=Terrabacter sp. C0L_2 TaxID=3108389 RepID=UPI002ED5D8EC|nr:2TM domain-containing protein [Terrabacter sp. C0L_2]